MSLESICLHLGYLLALVSYSVRDILWLRVLLVSSYLLLLASLLLPDANPPVNVYWFGLFISINFVRILLLLRERRPIQLSSHEQRVYDLAFQRWPRRDFKRFLKIAEVQSFVAGQSLIKQGERLDSLLFLSSGGAQVSRHGQRLSQIRPGQFLGEMSYLTQKDTAADVTGSEDGVYLQWRRADLKKLFLKRRQLEIELQNSLGYDLVGKLQDPENHH